MSRLRPSSSEAIKPLLRKEHPAPPPEDPKLLWPSVNIGATVTNLDVPHFPDMYWIQRRHEAGKRQGQDERKRELHLQLNAFDHAVAQSENCVLVLDPHFDDVGVEALASGLMSSTAKDIRLLTGKHSVRTDKWRKRLEEFRNMDRTGSDRAQVDWSKRQLWPDAFPFLHDRFAVVDGALWHFGSTVGGGHEGLTAASGPWPEHEVQAKKFFDKCWWRLHE